MILAWIRDWTESCVFFFFTITIKKGECAEYALPSLGYILLLQYEKKYDV